MKPDNGPSPDSSGLRVVKLSDVPDHRPAIAEALGISLAEAGLLLAAKGSLEDAVKILTGIIDGRLSRSTRQASAEWRGRLAADLLKKDDEPWFDEDEAS
jgi:hypothetical protein